MKFEIHVSKRCPSCGWLFFCPREQLQRVECRRCESL